MTKLLLIVTGASRGLGRAIATAFCDAFDDVCAVLVARSQSGLVETAASLVKPGVKASVCVADLGDLDRLDENIDKILNEVGSTDEPFDRFIFVSNAGSLGHVGQCIEAPSLQDMRQAVDFNVTAALWTSVRMARFAALLKAKTTIFVNISSLVAVQPFPTMAIYSAGKAARDSYHTAMAAELKDNAVKILNYAPGPLETDMATQLRSAEALDDDLKPHFEKKLVDPADSAAVLVKLVLDDSKFESGQHIDYYDVQT